MKHIYSLNLHMWYDIEPFHHGNGILQSVFGFPLLFLCYTQCWLVVNFPESLSSPIHAPSDIPILDTFSPIQKHLSCSPLSKLTYIISHSLKLWDISIDTFINICLLTIFCFLREGMNNLGILRTVRRPVREALPTMILLGICILTCTSVCSISITCVQFQYPVSA